MENDNVIFSVGTKFEVVGWVMLKGLDDGCKYVVTIREDNVVQFARILKNGKKAKKQFAHYLSDMESSVNCKDRCLNHINIL